MASLNFFRNQGFPLGKNTCNESTIRSSDVEILEIAQAREIYNTYCFTKDRILVNKQCQYAAKWYGKDGARRILVYVKQFYLKELI